jgi:hypothetical protein
MDGEVLYEGEARLVDKKGHGGLEGSRSSDYNAPRALKKVCKFNGNQCYCEVTAEPRVGIPFLMTYSVATLRWLRRLQTSHLGLR